MLAPSSCLARVPGIRLMMFQMHCFKYAVDVNGQNKPGMAR